MSKNKSDNLIYIDKNIIKNIIKVFIIGLLLLFVNVFINFDATNDMINVMSSIICLSTMVVAFVISSYSKNNFFIFIGIAFLFIGTVNILNMFANCNETYKLLVPNRSYINLFLELVEVFFIYISYRILLSKGTLKSNVLIFVILNALCVILQMSLENLSPNINKGVNIVISLISIFVTLYILKNLKSKLILKDKICYFKLFLIMILLVDLLNVYNFYDENKIATFFSNLIDCYGYLLMFVVIFQKLFNNSYNLLFENLYKRDRQLNKIIKEVTDKTSQLEKRQLVLKNREENYKTLFYNLPIPMAIVNKVNDRVIYTNKNFLNLLKLSHLKQVINKNIHNLLSFELFSMNDSNASNLNFEVEVKNSNPKTYLEVREFINFYNLNESLFIFEDITEDKKVKEMELKVEKKKLERKIKSEFLSSISHDLKTPVNVIYSSVQLQKLLLDNDNFDAINKYNTINKQNCIRLIGLTNNIIDSSKINQDYLKPDLEIINIVDLVENLTTHTSEYSKNNNVDLIFDTNEEEIYVLCDKIFMERIVMNLVSNSIKYTNNGAILVNIKGDKTNVCIEVIDNGSGMDEEFLRVAFDRYSKGKNAKSSNYKSSGIGLHVVKNLVELQGGSIKIESKKNVGTKVSIIFARRDNVEEITK